MAPRPRRSKQKQNLLVEHGEKFVFGLLVLGLGWAVYGAITHPTYTKKPEELKRNSDTKLTQILNASPDKTFEEQFPTENFAEKVKESSQPIGPDEYAIVNRIHVDSAIGLGEKRDVPQLLPLDEISARFVRMSLAITPQVAGGGGGTRSSGVAVQAPQSTGEDTEGAMGGRRLLPGSTGGGIIAPGGSIPRGKMAIVVVGRVPVEEQAAIYRQVYRKSRFSDALRDTPNYVSFLIERADVTDGEENPRWTQVTPRNQSLIVANLLETQEWALAAPEIVNQRHVRRLTLDPSTHTWDGFTFPLPPRLLEDWGSEATCNSIKKMDMQAQEVTPGVGPREGGETPPPTPGGTNPFTTPPTNPFGGQGGAPPMSRNQFQPQRPPLAQRFAQQLPGGGVGIRSPEGTPFNEEEQSTVLRGADGREIQPDILFRFFDFQIELNRRYQYRVKLVLRNPNYGLPERYLQSADLGKSPYIFSPDSNPSPAVSVSGFSEVLAGPVKPPRGLADASTSIIIRNRDSETGATVAYEFTGIERGSLLNYTVVKRVLKDGKEIGPIRPNPIDGSAKVVDAASFESNALLLDLRGGTPIPGSSTNRVEEPGGVLLLDDNGFLTVRGSLANQLTDFVEAKKRLADLETALPEAKSGSEENDLTNPPRGGKGLGGRVGGDTSTSP